MQPPEDVKLSREDGEALIERIQASNLRSEDQGLLVKLIRVYFWLTLALQETKISLKRLRVALFGEGRKKPKPPGGDGGGMEAGGEGTPAPPEPSPTSSAPQPSGAEPEAEQRRGHGRWGAEAYAGADEVVCHHDTLAAGQPCPACSRGTLYPLPAGVEVRVDGNALLSAVRYALERLRGSACGQVFTAPRPAEAGEEKYTVRARAVLVLSRYSLGVPFYRLEGFQALVGVPVADATQWDLVELVAEVGTWTICLYFAGRAHAGENLAKVLVLREPERGPPIVMSDALSVNTINDDEAIIRSHCLAHGRRKFTEIEEGFPAECQGVIDALDTVFEHEATTRAQGLTAAARLAYHPEHSGPIMAALKVYLEEQIRERLVEPNGSLGKGFQYLLNHWERLTQFLRVPGAPLDNNTVERALKLMIRQRRNSLFYASTHSAYVASILTSVIATCARAGINALAYLVALPEHRSELFRNPSAWLPWNYTEQMA